MNSETRAHNSTVTRPNVLIIYTDQQRWDALGANGNVEIRTPVLDRLAAEGANFSSCFVQCPVCMPSRVSFLTGRYPSALGITHMGVPVPEDTVTAATIFGRAGYHTANIGKLHFLPHANRDHTLLHPAYGFEHLEISDEPGCYEDAYRAWVRRTRPEQLPYLSLGLPPAREIWNETMQENDLVMHPPANRSSGAGFDAPVRFRGDDDVTHTAFVSNRVCEFIRSRASASEPFFCIAGIYSPHSPWVAPSKYFDLYDPGSFHISDQLLASCGSGSDPVSGEMLREARHGYYAMVSEVDDHVGKMLACLDETGQTGNTIIIFTSDHGEWLGENGKFGKGWPGTDGASRVPLIVRAPGLTRPASRIDSLVEAVDVLPTLLEMAGLPVPSFLQGKSLVPPILDGSSPTRDSALIEHHGWRTLRVEGYSYVLNRDGSEMLFDLASDPCAIRNVAAGTQYAAVLSRLRREMALRQLWAHQPLPRVWPY